MDNRAREQDMKREKLSIDEHWSVERERLEKSTTRTCEK